MIIVGIEFLFNIVNSDNKTSELISIDNIKYATPKNIDINNNTDVYALVNGAIKIINKDIDTYLKKIDANIFVPYKNPSIEYIRKENNKKEYILQLCYHQNKIVHDHMFSEVENGFIIKPDNDSVLTNLYKNHNMALNGLPLN